MFFRVTVAFAMVAILLPARLIAQQDQVEAHEHLNVQQQQHAGEKSGDADAAKNQEMQQRRHTEQESSRKVHGEHSGKEDAEDRSRGGGTAPYGSKSKPRKSGK